MPNPNENCLAGMRCPKCAQTTRFRIVGTCWSMVYDDGVDETYEHEWDEDSVCACPDCGHIAKVKDFYDPECKEDAA